MKDSRLRVSTPAPATNMNIASDLSILDDIIITPSTAPTPAGNTAPTVARGQQITQKPTKPSRQSSITAANSSQELVITPILISNEELASLHQQRQHPHPHHVGRGKKWQPEEDELLSQAWLRVSSEDPLQNAGDQRVNDTFWNRVSDEFLRSCPGSNRPPRSIQQRWAKLHQSISQFGECYEEQESRSPAGTSTEVITVEALKQYKSKIDQNFPHYSCWTLLRHTNQWIGHLNKPRMLPIKRKLNESNEEEIPVAVLGQTNSNDMDQSRALPSIYHTRPASDSGICSSNSSSYYNPNEPSESNRHASSSAQQLNKNTKRTQSTNAKSTHPTGTPSSSSSSTLTKAKKIALMEKRLKLIEELNQSMIRKNQILEEFNRLEKETNQIKIMSQHQSNESQLWFKLKQQEILNEFNLKILQ